MECYIKTDGDHGTIMAHYLSDNEHESFFLKPTTLSEIIDEMIEEDELLEVFELFSVGYKAIINKLKNQ